MHTVHVSLEEKSIFARPCKALLTSDVENDVSWLTKTIWRPREILDTRDKVIFFGVIARLIFAKVLHVDCFTSNKHIGRLSGHR